jgi:hypothetical protein
MNDQLPPGVHSLEAITSEVCTNVHMNSMSSTGRWTCSSDHLPHSVQIKLESGESISVMTWNLLSESYIENIKEYDPNGQCLNEEKLAKVDVSARYYHQMITLRWFYEEAESRRDFWFIVLQEVDPEFLSRLDKLGLYYEKFLHNKLKNIYRCVVYNPDQITSLATIDDSFNFLTHYYISLTTGFQFILGNYHLPFNIKQKPFKALSKYSEFPLLLCGDFNSMFQPKNKLSDARSWQEMLNYLRIASHGREFLFTLPFYGATHMNHLKNVSEHRIQYFTQFQRRFDCFDQILLSDFPVSEVTTLPVFYPTKNPWSRPRK